MAFTLTQTLSYQTKQYLEEAYHENDVFKTHVIGRFQLLGTALVGTLEIVVRLALFILGQVAGLFSLSLYKVDKNLYEKKSWLR